MLLLWVNDADIQKAEEGERRKPCFDALDFVCARERKFPLDGQDEDEERTGGVLAKWFSSSTSDGERRERERRKKRGKRARERERGGKSKSFGD